MNSNQKSKKQSMSALSKPTAKACAQREHLLELAQLAQVSKGTLLSTQWRGATALYDFRHETDAVFTMTGAALKANGWPVDLADRQRRSKLRLQEFARGRLSNDELYSEFKRQVELNHAKVISPDWLGAKVNHEVRLRDGTIKGIKPNQIKNYGWPAEPLVNLTAWANANELKLLSVKWVDSQATYTCRLKNGMFVEGTPAKLRAMVAHDFVQKCDEALAWAAENGVSLLTQHWQGLSQEYDLLTPDGSVKRMSMSAAMSGHLLGDIQAFYTIRRKAKELGLSMLDLAWRADGVYTWACPDGERFTCTWATLNSNIKSHRKLIALREYGQAFDATLLSQTWSGSTFAYRWRMADGAEVVMAKYGLEACARKCAKNAQDLTLLALWAERLGLSLKSTQWAGKNAEYTWESADGTEVTCNQYNLLDAIGRANLERTSITPDTVIDSPGPILDKSLIKLNSISPAELIIPEQIRKVAGAHRDKFEQLKSWSQAEGLVLLASRWTGSMTKYTWILPDGLARTTTPAQMRHEIGKRKLKQSQ